MCVRVKLLKCLCVCAVLKNDIKSRQQRETGGKVVRVCVGVGVMGRTHMSRCGTIFGMNGPRATLLLKYYERCCYVSGYRAVICMSVTETKQLIYDRWKKMYF